MSGNSALGALIVTSSGASEVTADNDPHRCDVTNKLKKGVNELVILFTSAFLMGKQIEEQHLGKDKHLSLWNGDPSRLFVRKAGYNCESPRRRTRLTEGRPVELTDGWDWGPILMTAGPWKPIRLEIYTARIIDL